jgi:lysophospholipase L1-like esterase
LPMMAWDYLEKMTLRRLAFGVLIVTVFAVGACGGSSSPTSPTNPNPPNNPEPPPPSGPTITCPGPMTQGSPNGAPVAVSFATPTTSAPAVIACTPASGAPFPVGSTTVQCTATTANNQTASCSFTVTVTPPLPQLQKTNFLAFGDSMTQGEVTNPASTSDVNGFPAFTLQIVPSAAYPRQLQMQLASRYTQQVIQMTNAGIGGETATQGAQRFPGVLSSLRPEVVLLLDGANDLSARGEAGFSTAIAAVESMAKDARFRNARVFLATLPPPRSGGRNTISDATIRSFNSRLSSIARGEGAILVDLYGALSSSVTTYIGADGLHPTEAGYQKMAETFFNAIRADLEVRLQ